MAPNHPPAMEAAAGQHGGRSSSSSSTADQELDQHNKGILEKMHKCLLLLAILAATVTYNAGLAPPGGVWADDADGHVAGDPVLQAHYPVRYSVFFYCNATAFVASLVITMLLLSSTFSFHGYRVRALQAAMALDLIGLLGAFAAGGCRSVRTSAFVLALVAVIVAYLVAHLLLHFCIRSNRCPSHRRELVELLNLHRCHSCCVGAAAKDDATTVAQAGTEVPAAPKRASSV
uniref:PGG domain-containing protein n=1 Tax=Oryza meridionalis TaxID=40149 RepID=A0A0E0E0P2_9ORYZ